MTDFLPDLSPEITGWLTLFFAVLVISLALERIFARRSMMKRYYDEPIAENQRNYAASLENQQRIIVLLELQLQALGEMRDRLPPR